jgi:mRNA interferase RelE/StbE
MPLTGLVITKAALNNLARIPPKIRAQLVKKAKALIRDPHPQGSRPLKGITTNDGEPVYRQRSGDYRILYIVRQSPTTKEVIVLDIDNRKDVYK